MWEARCSPESLGVLFWEMSDGTLSRLVTGSWLEVEIALSGE